jgi:ADP-heptose:LPS heptosyltransferase
LKKYLVIQTASIGDVILSTALGESLKNNDAYCRVDYFVRKGNESIFFGNKEVNKLFVWDKKNNKYKNLYKLLKLIQKERYDEIFNLQRFASTGFLTIFAGANKTNGYKKNPLSLFYSKRFQHKYSTDWHETDRNHQLIEHITGPKKSLPKLYPSKNEFAKVSVYKTKAYITISPASLWYTKQFPKEKWVEFIKLLPKGLHVYFLGSAEDKVFCDLLIDQSGHKNSINFAGKFTIAESAALMRDALMNFVNDSAAQHIASSMNAKTTSIFCSTVTSFGFGPLSDDAIVVETEEKLECRPCGLHGHHSCPEKHFKCALNIDTKRLLKRIDYAS